jgi:hypothetical protein
MSYAIPPQQRSRTHFVGPHWFKGCLSTLACVCCLVWLLFWIVTQRLGYAMLWFVISVVRSCVYELCYLWISQTNNIKLYPEISVVRREEDKQIITIFKSDLICVQETKMASMDAAIITNCLGRDYEENFKFLPADDIMRGGEGVL